MAHLRATASDSNGFRAIRTLAEAAGSASEDSRGCSSPEWPERSGKCQQVIEVVFEYVARHVGSQRVAGRRDFYRLLRHTLGLQPSSTAANLFLAVETHVHDLRRDQLYPVFLVRRMSSTELSSGRTRLPIIAVTAHAGEENAERIYYAGVDSHITKPFSVTGLEDVVARQPQRDHAPRSEPLRYSVAAR